MHSPSRSISVGSSTSRLCPQLPDCARGTILSMRVDAVARSGLRESAVGLASPTLKLVAGRQKRMASLLSGLPLQVVAASLTGSVRRTLEPAVSELPPATETLKGDLRETESLDLQTT